MKKTIALFGLLLSTTMIMVSCGHDEHRTVVKKTPEVNITTTVNPADGLDLKLVGALMQNGNIKNATDLETELNKDGGINNLDLDGNGSVDYINVSENQAEGAQNVKSFDLTTGIDSNMTYIATVEVEKGVNDEYHINMSGSEHIYGSGHHYHSSFHSVGEMMFYAWLFSPRPYYYHPPYHVGFYPSYYGGGHTIVSRSVYTQRTSVQRTTANKTVSRSNSPTTKVTSKNQNKVAKNARTSINNNAKTQKQFQARNTSKAVGKGGFTKKATPSATTSKANTPTKSSPAKSVTSKPKSSGFGSRSSSSRRSSGFGSRSSSRSSGFGSSSRRSGGFGGGGGRRRSDIAYKMDVQPMDGSLDKVLKMEGVTYYWQPISNYNDVVGGSYDSTRQVGFIAQDLELVVPEVVNEDAYGKVVSYDLLVPILVEAIKEQQKEINELKEQLISIEHKQ